jgi:hypothetical protein
MRKVFFLWIVLTAACAGAAQERGAAPYGYAPPATKGESRTRLLPIGDALVFASIGTGLVFWLRKRHTF